MDSKHCPFAPLGRRTPHLRRAATNHGPTVIDDWPARRTVTRCTPTAFGRTRVRSAQRTAHERLPAESLEICGCPRPCLSTAGRGDDDGVSPQQAAIATGVGGLVTRGKLSEAAAKWSSRLPWVPVRQWSTASGGGCVAGRARVDHGCVRARVVGKRKPHLPQPGAMADASSVRHHTIVVPETMSPAQVRALAERKAQA